MSKSKQSLIIEGLTRKYSISEGTKSNDPFWDVRYTYSGDSLSDYETNIWVQAKNGKEAVKRAEKYLKEKNRVNGPDVRNFRLDSNKPVSDERINNKYSNIEKLVLESIIYEGVSYDFSKDADRKKACDEYSKCMQNNLSSSSEKRMDELDKLADNVGLKFFMTNYNAYIQPHALVKPRYELVAK